MNHTRQKPRGAPASLEIRRRMEDLIERVGQTEALRRTGLSRIAFATALGGLPVYPGTIALISNALAASPELEP